MASLCREIEEVIHNLEKVASGSNSSRRFVGWSQREDLKNAVRGFSERKVIADVASKSRIESVHVVKDYDVAQVLKRMAVVLEPRAYPFRSFTIEVDHVVGGPR